MQAVPCKENLEMLLEIRSGYPAAKRADMAQCSSLLSSHSWVSLSLTLQGWQSKHYSCPSNIILIEEETV